MAGVLASTPRRLVAARRRVPLHPRAVFESPLTSYYLLSGATALLVGIGLVMVLSSSSVEALQNDRSPYATFVRQALFAGIGLPLMLVASRLRVATWRRLAWPLLALAVAAQLAVFTPLGYGVKGNRNWVRLGTFTMQPSEAAKLALVVWCAGVLSTKAALLTRWRHLLVPVLPVAALSLGLVLWGRDLGTALVMMLLVAGIFFVAGAPLRLFAVSGVAVGALVVTLVRRSPNRVARIAAWWGGQCSDYQGTCWQATHGKWALASGGWWGAGLGAGKEKWSWLPEAHNDFIYAVIGEELGLPGTIVIIALFAVLGVACLRLVRRSDDLFVKVATGGVMIWVLGQAAVNIGVVLGLLPVLGVPLPLVSSGGSALLVTMVALGMLLSFARAEPRAARALAARPGVVHRSAAVVQRPAAARSTPARRDGPGGGPAGSAGRPR